MAPRGGVRVNITGDSSQLKRELDDADRKVGRFAGDVEKNTSRIGNAWGKASGAITAAGTAAIAAGGYFAFTAIQAASDSEQMAMRAEAAFGSAFGAVEKFAEGSADALGISRRDYMRFTSEFGALFKGMGKNEDQAAFMSVALTDLAANVASFNDVSTPEVIDAMTAAFRDEYDSLQKFIPVINDAAVKQYALNNGLGDGKTFTDDAAKAQAIYGFMLANTAQQQGDVERSQDTLSQKTKELTARFDNLKVELGEKLLPIAVVALEAIDSGLDDLTEWWNTDGRQWLEDFKAGWRDLKTGFDGFKAGVDELIRRWESGTSAGDSFMARFSEHMDEAGWGVDEFQRGLDNLRDSWGPFWDRFMDGVERFKNGWRDFTNGFSYVVELAQLVGSVVADIFRAIAWMAAATGDVVGAIFGAIGGAISWLVDKTNELRKTVGELVGLVPDMFSGEPGAWGSKLYDIFEGKAVGGPVMGSRPYIVGERGPELFVPGVSGSIVPNHALGGGGMTVNQYFEGVPVDAQLEAANRRMANLVTAASIGG